MDKGSQKAGANYAVLTTKHTDGWCLWDSKYTDHDITAFKNYKKGNGDIIKEFVDACRKIKCGLVFTIAYPVIIQENQGGTKRMLQEVIR